MDETLDKAFHYGYDRTEDLLALIPEGDEGLAEVVGIVIAGLYDFADRMDISIEEAIDRVSSIITKD